MAVGNKDGEQAEPATIVSARFSALPSRTNSTAFAQHVSREVRRTEQGWRKSCTAVA
jgi:hypothetical protein